MYKGLKKLAEDCGLPSAEKYTLFILMDTDTHKKGVELLLFLHPLIAVLGKPVTKDIVIQQSHAIAWRITMLS